MAENQTSTGANGRQRRAISSGRGKGGRKEEEDSKEESSKEEEEAKMWEKQTGAALHRQITRTLNKVQQELGKSYLTVTVLGASGHLARTKTFPALFELFKKQVFPPDISIVGYARSALTDEDFKKRISEKFAKDPDCAKFLALCVYHKGSYDKNEDFAKLNERICGLEGEKNGNRMFYMALPPKVFGSVAGCLKASALGKKGWNRVIIEKPFGKSLASSDALQAEISKSLVENQVYRIDHYLAKELIQNVIALRFSNPILTPLWNRNMISAVKITFKEDAGVDGRGGYYNESGCIRDVIQNHLFQVLSLVAMETPKSLSAEHIRDAKVSALKCIKPPSMDQVVVGQYIKNGDKPGFLEDETVPNDSKTETFCQMVLFVDNERWRGVPFVCKAGKALDERRGEIRIQFHQPKDSIYPNAPGNELVIRIQPDEAMWLRVNAKTPGLANISSLIGTELDLTYQQRFNLGTALPGAYTRLILDVMRGDQSLFVRADELKEAWRIVDPLLTKIKNKEVEPSTYVRGSRGPEKADDIARKYLQVPSAQTYSWPRTEVDTDSVRLSYYGALRSKL